MFKGAAPSKNPLCQNRPTLAACEQNSSVSFLVFAALCLHACDSNHGGSTPADPFSAARPADRRKNGVEMSGHPGRLLKDLHCSQIVLNLPQQQQFIPL